MKSFYKKRIMGLIIIAVIMIFAGTVLAEEHYNPQYQNKGTIGTQSRQWREGHFKAFYSRDGSGNMETYLPPDRVYVIDNQSELSTLSGAAAGQSYYQLDPGKTYVIDPYAILESMNTALGYDEGGTSAWPDFAGISVYLPDASTYSGPAYDTQVIMAVTGNTGWPHLNSGGTVIQVWPFPGTAGISAYGIGAENYAVSYRSGCTPQTLQTEYTTNGTTSTTAMASGVSYWEINKPGENAVFALEDSSVSAYVKRKKVTN